MNTVLVERTLKEMSKYWIKRQIEQSNNRISFVENHYERFWNKMTELKKKSGSWFSWILPNIFPIRYLNQWRTCYTKKEFIDVHIVMENSKYLKCVCNALIKYSLVFYKPRQTIHWADVTSNHCNEDGIKGRGRYEFIRKRIRARAYQRREK